MEQMQYSLLFRWFVGLGRSALMSFVKRRGVQYRVTPGGAGLGMIVRMGVGTRPGTLVNKL
jgi:hypothetical protein